jgi:hypothetical protein
LERCFGLDSSGKRAAMATCLKEGARIAPSAL